jgi:anti-sigma-K factor RskA
MNQEREEQRLDLLIKRAVSGLSDQEQAKLDEFEREEMNAPDQSLEITVAALSLIDADRDAAMPAGLRSKVLSDAYHWFDAQHGPARQPAGSEPHFSPDVPARSFWGWFGWAAAAAACIALVANIWVTRFRPAEVARDVTPTPTPVRKIGPEQMREQLISSAPDLIRVNIGPGTMKDLKPAGDVVWSDAGQSGYLRLAGLPKNDPGKETYQLWIVAENQDPKTPVDGGVFDVSSDGEVIIPIDPRVKVSNPKAFAITVEKPGGVVVSKQEKVAALGKNET